MGKRHFEYTIEERKDIISVMLKNNATIKEIAFRLNLSRQHTYLVMKELGFPIPNARSGKGKSKKIKRLENLLRSKMQGYTPAEYKAVADSIIIPEVCPVTGEKISYENTQGFLSDSPSIFVLNKMGIFRPNEVMIVSRKASSLLKILQTCDLERTIMNVKRIIL